MFIGPAGPYADTCIHLRDLAHPQGLDVTVPVERWKVALDVIVAPRGQGSFVPRRGMLKGLRWQAPTPTGPGRGATGPSSRAPRRRSR